MNPLLAFSGLLAAGFCLAVCFELFNAKTVFAKAHGTVTLFAQLAIIVAAALVAVHVTHDSMSWFLILLGFVGFSKLKEFRASRLKLKTLAAQFQAAVASALASRQGAEAVEVDVSKAPDTVLQTLISDSKKQGLTVETVKNQSTGAVKLRLSGTAEGSK